MRPVVLLLVLSLSACAVAAAPPPVTPIEATGDWQHAGSELVFPVQLGDFARQEIIRYDRAGTAPAYGVGYNHQTATSAVTFTVYVGPPLALESGEPASLQEQLQAEKAVILRRDGCSQAWSRPVTLMREGRALSGFGAEFLYAERFAQQYQPVVSQLFLVASGDWVIKYRISFPVVQETASRAAAEALLAAAPWGALPAR